MSGPLEGIRVLDFTHAMSGPFGTMVLSDLGAEVINVQRPHETDRNRGNGPFVNGRSTYRFSLERGKKGIQVDLKQPEGLEVALRLLDESDVLTENFSVGTMDSLGLGYGAVSQRNPRIIYASCTGFGQTGPYARRGAVDIIAQGMSGIMSMTGEPDGRPMRPGISLGDSLGGAYLAMGVLSALYEREKSGIGQRIDVSMLESVVYHMENAVIRYSATGEAPKRIGPRHPLSSPFQPFETNDGWIVVAGVRDWEAFCVLLDVEELAADPRFKNAPKRSANHDDLEPVLAKAFRKKSSAEWLEALESVCLIAPLYDVAEMVADPHIKERHAIIDLPVPGPEEQWVKVPNCPVRLSRTPTKVDSPGPGVGEHTEEVLRELLSMTPEALAALLEKGAVASHPLASQADAAAHI